MVPVKNAALRARAEDGVEQTELLSLRLQGELLLRDRITADEVGGERVGGVRGGRVHYVQLFVLPERGCAWFES